MSVITIPAFYDMHVHLREWEDAPWHAAQHSRWCERSLAMPNLKQPLVQVAYCASYWTEIRKAVSGYNPLVAWYLSQDCSPQHAEYMWNENFKIVKAYPKGITTGSDHGISDWLALYPCFEVMERLGMTLCLHGENPGSFVLGAESEFLVDVLKPLLKTFSKLRVTLEHITTADAVLFVESHRGDNLRATITAHHLLMTLDDVLKHGLRPTNYCKPVAKYPSDRLALLAVATGKDHRFMLGSDSAPHDIKLKQSGCGCAGVYTAPYLPLYLAKAFEECGRLSEANLKAFCTDHARSWYGLPEPTRSIRLKPGNTRIPIHEGKQGLTLCPFMGGQEIGWEAF